jgi:hypothetical protein
MMPEPRRLTAHTKRGMHRLSITLTDAQLDALEKRGYLVGREQNLSG